MEELSETGKPLVTDDETNSGHHVDMDQIVTGAINEKLGQAERYKEAISFTESFKDKDRVAIVAHDNPDPDAIGSAMAVQYIGEEYGVDSEII